MIVVTEINAVIMQRKHARKRSACPRLPNPTRRRNAPIRVTVIYFLQAAIAKAVNYFSRDNWKIYVLQFCVSECPFGFTCEDGLCNPTCDTAHNGAICCTETKDGSTTPCSHDYCCNNTIDEKFPGDGGVPTQVCKTFDGGKSKACVGWG